MCIVLRVDPLRGLDTPPTFPGSSLRTLTGCWTFMSVADSANYSLKISNRNSTPLRILDNCKV